MHHLIPQACGALALGIAVVAHAQSTAQSPTSSHTPYSVPVPGGPAVDVVAFLTVGDSVNAGPGGAPYRLAGIPDGMGAYDNGDGTMTLLVNHELGATSAMGFVRAHQVGTGFSGGSFVSRWIVRTSPGPDFLRVLDGSDLMEALECTTNGAGGNLFTLSRLCSADLAAPAAYFNPATGKGTEERIYTTGEESGPVGRMLAVGVLERVGRELPAFTPLQGNWENGVARPYASDTTLVMALSDGGPQGIFAYIGSKTAEGHSAERAGLMNGVTYGIQVVRDGVPVGAESRDLCFASSGAPVYAARFSLNAGNACTAFLRPEDGAWDPANPRDFYFVTTDRLDTTETGGTQIGRSRLFRMRFDDVENPLAGGEIEALLTGAEGQNMLDNLCVFNDLAGGTRLLLQEDPGNAAHNAKTFLYTVATGALQVVLQSDPVRFGDLAAPATAPFNADEENSGVIDARDVLGLGWFIACTQAHYTLPGELVQGGQLCAFYLPAAVGSCMEDLSPSLDGVVGGEDLSVLLANWGNPGRSDLNRDGRTDGADLGALLSAWGSCAK